MTSKVAISMDSALIAELDQMVTKQIFANRSQAIQTAVREKISRMKRRRLAEECAKLNPAEEQMMAEEGMVGELAQWPEY